MANKNSELGQFFEMIQKTLFTQCLKIDEDEVLFNFILDKLEMLGHDVEPILEFTNVYWTMLVFDTKNFHHYISNLYDRSYIGFDEVFTFHFNQENDTFYIFEIAKDKSKKTRKTLQEMENELDILVKEEKFEEAEKLKIKIETKKNKIKK